MNKQNVSATLEKNVLKDLDAWAARTERKRSWLINQAVKSYLEELEDLRLASERLTDATLSPAQMRKALGVSR